MTTVHTRHRGARVPVLMIVHAHPDDESSQTGGTLARYAAAGWRTIVITCTDGALGDAGDGAKPGDPSHDPRRVAAYRALELDAAARALNVHEVVKLGYPDSGVAGIDGRASTESFSQRPAMPMVAQLVRLIRMHQPDVLITYPPDGLSGHPDHVRTHELVIAAHANVVANATVPGPRLFYIALSVTRLRAAQAAVRQAFGDDAWAPPDGMGVDDAEITTTIDVTAFWDAKLRALAAHASQADAAMLLRVFSSSAGPDAAAAQVEQYVRVYPPVPAGTAAETDFFTA